MLEKWSRGIMGRKNEKPFGSLPLLTHHSIIPMFHVP
jgi:hypothetical protein